MKQIDELFDITKDFVRYYPKAEKECLRPDSFAVIAEYSDLAKESLSIREIDKYKPYFFSRKWELSDFSSNELKWGSPLVLFYEEGMNWQDTFTEKTIQRTYFLEMAILDKFNQDCGDKNDYCEQRTKHEIFRDTESILINYILYMRQIKLIRINDAYDRYMPEGLAIKLLAEDDDVVSYVVDLRGTEKFQRNLRISNNNKENVGYRFDTGEGLELYGTVIKVALMVETACQLPDFNFDFQKYEWSYNFCC